MAKAGMKHPFDNAHHGVRGNREVNIPKNTVAPVPQIQGRAKSGKEKANPF